MATNDDLSEQLTLTSKLSAQMERMAVAAERLEKSYDTQIGAVEKLASTFAQLNTSSTVQGIEVLNKSLKDVQDRMKETGKTSESTFQKMGKKVEETGKTISQKFPKHVLVGAAALSGFVQGVRNLTALSKGVTGFFVGFVDGLVNIAASIVAIPVKIFEGLVDLAAKSASGMNELAQELENLRKQFGAFYGPTNKAIIDTTKSLKGFSDTGLSAWKVFGNMAERLKYIRELATEMGGAFGSLRKEMEDNGGAILAYQKGLGVASEDMKGITRNAVAMGKKTSASLKEMTKQSYELGDAFELDAKLISRDMSKALTDVKHFGGATVKQIAEASTYARKLGFELKDITGTLDAFDTFDTAAENAAKLSQAFGVNIDAFELMKAQSPAEQLDLLRTSFKKAGVDASNFDRASLKLAATTTGLSEDIVQSALSLKNQGKTLEDIKKKGGDAEKKTLTQAQAMGKLADAIERMVQTGPGLSGGFWDMFIKGVLGGLQSTKEFRTMILNIQRALQKVYMIGVQLGKVLPDLIPGLKDFLGGMSDFFNPKHFTGLFQGISDSVKKYLDPKSSASGSIPMLLENLHKYIIDFFTGEGTNGKRILDGFKGMVTFMSKVLADGVKWMSGQLNEGLKYIVDLLSGRKSLSSAGISGPAGQTLGFLESVITPIAASLKNAWKLLQPQVVSLLKILTKKIVDFIKSDEFVSIIKPVLPYVALVLFGPAFGRAVVASLTSTLISAGTSALGSASKALLQKAAPEFFAKVFGAGQSGDIASGLEKSIASAMEKSKASGAGLGDSIGGGIIGKLTNKMGTVANAFASKLGASGVGSALGAAAGIAAAAYLAYEGKKLIDETFEKGHKSDVDLRGAEMQAWQAKGSRVPVEKKLEQIAQLQATIQDQEKALADKGFGEKALNWIAGTDIAADQAADALAKAKKTLGELQTQVGASQAAGVTGLEALRKKASETSEANKKMFGAETISEAKERLDDLEGVLKKMRGKGFDIGKSLDEVRGKLKDVSFEVLNAQQVGSLAVGQDTLEKLYKFSGDFTAVASSLSKLPDAARKASAAVKKDAIKPAIEAVRSMVDAVNKLDEALGNGNLNKVDIVAKLSNVARSVGLGAKASYSIENKGVNVTINMKVVMEAGLVERVIIERKGSIIRERLNFATNNPGAKGNNEISDTINGTPDSIDGSTQ